MGDVSPIKKLWIAPYEKTINSLSIRMKPNRIVEPYRFPPLGEDMNIDEAEEKMLAENHYSFTIDEDDLLNMYNESRKMLISLGYPL